MATRRMGQLFVELSEGEGLGHDDRARSRAYEAYIASAAWRGNPARLAELAASGGRCRICDRGPPRFRVEVHHRTYRGLGAERLQDLTTLCSECHDVVTRHCMPAARWAVLRRR